MLDKRRVLTKIDEMDSYLTELEGIIPKSYEEYADSIETKRACERLLHVLIECAIDVCTILVRDLKLGLPSEENDIFEKLKKKAVLSEDMVKKLKEMRGFRNILVHRYAEIDDELVFKILRTDIEDFKEFRKQIINFLEKNK